MSKAPRLRRLVIFLRDEIAASAAEFALAAPILFALMGACLEVGVVYLAKTELNRIAQKGTRAVLTLQAQNLTRAQFASLICANALIFDCSKLMVSLSPKTACTSAAPSMPAFTYDANGAITNTFAYDPGQAQDLMSLQIYYPFPVIAGSYLGFGSQPDGTLMLVSTSVFVNEP